MGSYRDIVGQDRSHSQDMAGARLSTQYVCSERYCKDKLDKTPDMGRHVKKKCKLLGMISNSAFL